MPCRYDPTPEEQSARYSDEAMKDALDLATRLLCSLSKRVPAKYIKADPELAAWVKQHAEMDVKREEAEKHAKLPFSFDTEYNFYGVDNTRFKLGKQVFEATEDPNDGYRSCLGSIDVTKASEGDIFHRTPLDKVKATEIKTEYGFQGYAFVSTKDEHEWLRVGTDYSDDCYPSFVFQYTPRAPKATRSIR